MYLDTTSCGAAIKQKKSKDIFCGQFAVTSSHASQEDAGGGIVLVKPGCFAPEPII